MKAYSLRSLLEKHDAETFSLEIFDHFCNRMRTGIGDLRERPKQYGETNAPLRRKASQDCERSSANMATGALESFNGPTKTPMRWKEDPWVREADIAKRAFAAQRSTLAYERPKIHECVIPGIDRSLWKQPFSNRQYCAMRHEMHSGEHAEKHPVLVGIDRGNAFAICERSDGVSRVSANPWQ
jgi:hypothetical protein